MKNLVLWIFVAIFVATSAVTAVHLRSRQESRQQLARIQPLYESMPIFPELRLAMEKYRRASGNFRKMYNNEIAASKAHLRNEFAQDLSKLEALNPTDHDQALIKSIQDQLDEMLNLSAKYEPQLFLKDAYQKPDVEEAHNAILKDVTDLQTVTEARLHAQSTKSSRDEDRALQLIVGAQIAILVLFLLMIVRNYAMHIRPTRKLAQYAKDLGANQTKPDIPKRIPLLHLGIAATLAELVGQTERLRDQRRKFIEDVIEDLRPGLAAVRRSQDVEGAMAILSSSIEDLKQMAEISRIEQRITLGIVDLSELVSDACKRASRAGLCPDIRVSVPELPTWVRVDAERVERAIIQLLSKVGETIEKGQTIEAILQVHGKPGLNGIELAFHSTGGRLSGAPELELSRHWMSHKGLALTLAQKIIKAHDGAIFASGLTGSPVQVSIKFPRTILTDGLVSPAKYTPAKALDLDNFNSL